MGIDWNQVIAAGAGLIGVMIGGLLQWWFDRRRQTRNDQRAAEYLVLRVSVELERFAVACALQLVDIGNWRSSGGHLGSPSTQLPAAPSYPPELAWDVVDHHLARQALSLPHQLERSQAYIDFCIEIEGSPDNDPPPDAEIDFAECGLEAWDLAAAMLKHYRMPGLPNPSAEAWDPIRVMRQTRDKLVAERHARQRANLPFPPAPESHAVGLGVGP